jgi:hypothetical protein
LREERRLKVFENRVLRRIFGYKRDEVKSEWRILYNEEAEDLYSPVLLDKKIENNDMGGACSTYGERRCVFRVLVEKPEGKTPLWRPRCRWERNINTLAPELSFKF